MAIIETYIWDITSSRSQMAELPDDIEIARLLVLLVERMNLPLNSPDGQIMSYKLHHKQSGKRSNRSSVIRMVGVDVEFTTCPRYG